ncbi:MAG: divalent metal cation transporter [Betaproteobacteria bacterium]|nr:divalent metal cation transporter [Betaproteobacteria bacterium]
MLADTDAGSVVTAAQSGAQWGYKLLALQLVLIPILFVVQELTVRLGLVTGRGHGELIRERFGAGWAWLSVSTLMFACVGALITEFTGIAGAGLLFGIPAWASMILAVTALLAIVWTGSYVSVERIAIALGAFELAFIAVVCLAHPNAHVVMQGLISVPLHDSKYLYLAAANVGAVIMPWMVFYQQSAVLDKGLTTKDLKVARFDTAVGAVVTQVIMAAVLMTTAATLGRTNPNAPLNTVQQIADALIPFLGRTAGQWVFVLGILGAALVAAIVVSLTAAWGLGEVAGYKRSLEHHPREAPWFYGIFTFGVLAAGAIVASGINLVSVTLAVEVMNALLLPVVLGFLFLLAIKTLPESHRLKGAYAWLVGLVCLATAGFGVYAGLTGAFS